MIPTPSPLPPAPASSMAPVCRVFGYLLILVGLLGAGVWLFGFVAGDMLPAVRPIGAAMFVQIVPGVILHAIAEHLWRQSEIAALLRDGGRGTP